MRSFSLLLSKKPTVGFDGGGGRALLHNTAVVEEVGTIAEALNGSQVVSDDDDGLASMAEFVKTLEALLLEPLVSHSQDLVNHQDVWVDLHGDGETQTGIHAGGVVLDGGVHVVFQFGEGHDALVALRHLRSGEPKEGAVEVEVLAAGELGAEARPELDHGGDLSVDGAAALGGPEDAREDLQERALAGPIPPDDAHDLPGSHGERDPAKRPQVRIVDTAVKVVDDRLFEGGDPLLIQTVSEPDILEGNRRVEVRCKGHGYT